MTAGMRSWGVITLSLAALSLCPVVSRAQTIQGRVVDAHAVLGIAGATVSAVGVLAVTDALGRFSLDAQGRGEVRLRIERLGYEPLDTLVVIASDVPGVEFELTPLPLTIPGLVVNAPAGHGFQNLGGEVRVQTPERGVQARGIGLDPMEGVAASGVGVPLNDLSAIPVVRGARSDQTALRLGELRLWAPHHGLGLVSPARTSGTREVRVSGAVPSVSEANATGATLTAEPRYDYDGLWVAPSANLLDAGLSLGGPLGIGSRSSFVATGTRSFDTGMLGSLLGGSLPLRYGSFEGHATADLTETVRVHGGVYASTDRVTFDASTFSENLTSRWQTKAWLSEIAWVPTSRDELRIRASHAWYDASLSLASAGTLLPGSTGELVDEHLFGAWSHQSRRFATLLALEFMRTSTETRGDVGAPGPSLTGRAQVDAVALSVGLEAVHGRTAVHGGVHVDAVRGHGALLQPRVEITRQLEAGWRVHASVGRTAQWVSALNAETIVPQAPIWWVHDDGYAPTTSDNAAVGVAGSVLPWARVRSELYARRVTNLTRWLEPWNGQPGLVQEDGWAAGIALDVVLWEGRQASLRWDHTIGRAVVDPGRAPPWDIRHAGDLRLAWRPAGWDFAVGASYASGRPLPVPVARFSGLELGLPFGLQYTDLYTVYSSEAQRLPSYFRLDLGVARMFRLGRGMWETSLKVLNATRRTNALYYQLANDFWQEPTMNDPGLRLWPVRQFPLVLAIGLHGTIR